MRATCSLLATLAFTVPAHALSCNPNASNAYTIPPGSYSAPQSYGVADFFTVLNQGNFDYATNSSTHNALNIGAAGGKPDTCGFTFTNQGAVAITAPPSDAGPTDFRILNLYALGTDKSDGNSPDPGGQSGPIALTINGSVSVTSQIASFAYGAYGIWVQSLGGRGDASDKGNVNGADGGGAGAVSAAIGGASLSVQTASTGTGAALRIQQVGGQGGEGNNDSRGGTGGTAQAQTITLTDSRLTTTGPNLAGLTVIQTGGPGGNGGLEDNQQNSPGGPGGAAAGISLTLAQGSGPGNAISTNGSSATAVSVLVQGGAGGTGANTGGGLQINSLGGNGGAGSAPGQITLNSSGAQSVTTAGAKSPAILLVSQGGAGGAGGEAQSLAGGTSGSGGSGGDGGGITTFLASGTTLRTTGDTSPGLVLRSLGGAGGIGGRGAGNVEIDSGAGGAGGAGGFVGGTLYSGVGITTTGSNAHGVVLQSVGAQGGKASDASGLISSSGSGGGGGQSLGLDFANQGTITTTGAAARGILAQSISGDGGPGANADATIGSPGAGGAPGSILTMTVMNSGTIATSGAGAQGILAQSIGGGGGTGGSTSGDFFSAQGGAGIAGASGGTVVVGQSGRITTSGSTAAGILAQSIGGGGGDGGDGSGVFSSNGGAGGAGGNGGAVTTTLGGSISTAGDLSHGVIAQSIGGGGGNGGNATAAGVTVTYTLGGTAGGGGTGSAVSTSAQGATIVATGSGADGILAQSIGGGGGSGGNASGITVDGGFSFAAAIGGTGGGGGSGGAVTVRLGSTTVTTGGGAGAAPPVDAIGVLAQSIGGGGGAGGGANALAVAVSRPTLPDEPSLAIAATYGAGGAGATAGNGGTVDLELGTAVNGMSGGATIRTAGTGSHGAVAQSIGGGGGQGGDSSAMSGTIGSTSEYGAEGGTATSVTLAVALGGTGGKGGSGGAVTISAGGLGTPSMVATTGDGAYGLLAQSVGGGGGNAGIGSATFDYTGNANNHTLTVGLGAKGGAGGPGGTVSVDLAGTSTVQTRGSGAIGVLAQSVGGGGGTSTGSTVDLGTLASFSQKNAQGEEGPFQGKLTSTISVGQTGASGGSGATAQVNHQGSVTTIGNDAPAIVVQSIGGGGGVGGSAGNDAGASAGASTSAAATRSLTDAATEAEDPPSNPFNPNITFQTALNLSVGGKGGTGGSGGAVTLEHGGRVVTSGDYAPGLVAQSIGGGGGRGGTAVAGGEGNSLSSIIGSALVTSNVSLGASGGGGVGGSAGPVTVTLDGGASVTTGAAGRGSPGSGVQSVGLLAQSIGGGGGTGADGTVQPNGLLFLGAGLAGGGGSAGSGNTVRLQQPSGGNPVTVTTSGGAGHGIVLQSIGGGGGLGGAGSTLAATVSRFPSLSVGLKLGGAAGSSGDGGSVQVDNPILDLRTAGMGAYGLVAQSIGGGGGLADVTGSPASLQGLGGQGGSGNGGPVTVQLPQGSSIATTGLGAHGLVAQSVGGGGGIATGYQAGVTPALVGPPAFGTSSGNGGAVSVTALGSITTTGPGAFGIIAQSVGRGGGLATIGSQFYAASMGGASSGGLAGTVLVDLQGTISATGENAVGVFAQSVNGQTVSANTVTVNLGVYAPARVTGGSGQGAGLWIESGNAGNTISVGGGSSVAALSNLAINYTGGSGVNVLNDGTITGSTTLGSSAYTLTNRGTLQPSATGTGEAVIAGSFVQTPAGRLATQADFAARTAGRFVVTGDAQLAGTVQARLASVVANTPVPVLTVQGRATGSLSAASTALFDFAVVPSAGEAEQRFDLVATGSRLADPRFALTPGRQAVAGYLDRVFAAGTPQFGTFFAGLDRAASSPGDYGQRIGQLGPRSVLSVGAQRAQDAAFVANAAMSCPVFAAGTAFLTEGACTYARLGGRTTSVGADADRGRMGIDSTVLQIGGQGELAPGWFLGGSLAYETGRLDGRDGVRGGLDVGHGVLTLKRQEGPWLLTGAAFGSVGQVDLRRTVGLPGVGGLATGSTTPTTLGGRLRAAYTIGTETLYLRPFLNLDVVGARFGSYTEAGLGAFGLRHDAAAQTAAILTPALEVGLRTNLDAGMVLRSFVSAGVDIRTSDTWRATTRLIGAPAGVGGFTTLVPQDRAAARVSAGLQLFANEAIDLRAQYDGGFSDRATIHGGMLTFSYRM
ncbi:autotransporter outer membrane beta-barrel domain-containing protein [Methylobacterium oryzihabitans]|uniref:Autotransporter outer membrane beta-barrel domain-containing protein n=1 Tax=Methylobacterium oryzihabitans TaxID=2499852 RepID=A0A437PA07_9HYPH|nr:autotransporter outer membrane beta-barrel domain-containing protein [Methylobacterium oryzihabitans]RVU19109.1 autotransporter outer membrane beta-barrel domain-containing protein [Methylobacterium oryzihabitans]